MNNRQLLTRASWSIALLGAGAAAGWYLIDAQFWDQNKQPLLVALSVVAAAVLVRLARGMPITNTDFFEVSEIRKLTAAVRQLMRSLRALIIATLGCMFALIAAKPLLEYFKSWPALSTDLDAGRLMSALIALLTTYVFFRIIQVVYGDYDLVELQASYMIRTVERREARRFEEQHIRSTEPFKTPEGYGKQIQ
jgi:hypothetical protein